MNGTRPAVPKADPAPALAFDARLIGPEPSGIGQVGLELLRGLSQRLFPEAILVLVNADTYLSSALRGQANLVFEPLAYGPYGAANQCLLPGLLRRRGVRLLHAIDAHVPLVPFGGKLVVHVHDLIPLVCPARLSGSRKGVFHHAWKAWLSLLCRRACRVVTPSAHAARDITSSLAVPPEKVRVLPNPVRHWDQPLDPEALRRRLGLAGRVIAYVGRQAPYKNVGTLIRAIPVLNRLLPGPPVQLVVAGSRNDRHPELRRLVADLGLQRQVCFPGYLDEPDLGALYRLSRAFAFPSLHEGFGLPPLEAMRFGTPVVAGLHSALPEVLGDAALYVDTTDPAALAAGLAAVLTDPYLAARLRLEGRRRLERYSRERVSESFLELYREVLDGAAPFARRHEPAGGRRACAPGTRVSY
jgi:glycosyltransferase involved in cell wall biosynthesis